MVEMKDFLTVSVVVDSDVSVFLHYYSIPHHCPCCPCGDRIFQGL